MKLILLVLILLLFVMETYVLGVWKQSDVKLPALFGNFDRVRTVLANAPTKAEFSFAVVGDTRGANGVFEKIANKLYDESIDFLVLLGDCTKGTEFAHRYFRGEIAREYRFSCPIFYVVGNHDINKKLFPLSRFESLYGPTLFSFTYQNCLFIVLRLMGDRNSNQESLRFLKTFLHKNGTQYRKKFVFMHIPPPFPPVDSRKFKSPAKLIDLFSRLRIDYVFAAHLHGYVHTDFRDTTYIVTGGGGASLDKRIVANFHHAVVIRVGKDYVSEKIIMVDGDVDFEDKLESYCITRIYPWFSKHHFTFSIFNIFLLLALIGTVFSIYRQN